MEPTSDDKLAASVFALGLSLGFVRREDVVQWADRRINEIDEPPAWLIDISLSHAWRLIDLIHELTEVAKEADPETVCKVAFGLLPDVRSWSFEDAEAMAKFIYNMTRLCIPKWDHELNLYADSLDDTFSLVRSGYCTMTGPETIAQLAEFIEGQRDKSMGHVLYPAAWSDPWPNGKSKPSGDV